MAQVFIPVNVAGYNAAPPPNDGSETAQNRVSWGTHLEKIGDPLRAAVVALSERTEQAFDCIFHNATTALTIDTVLSPTQRGRTYTVANETTITLPAASAAGTTSW